MNNYPFMNPYGSMQSTVAPMQQSQVTIPQYTPVQQKKIPRVHGIEGANALPMAPDSEEIALDIDSTKPLQYIIVTDSAGYKTVTPGIFTPIEQTKEKPLTLSDLDSINERVSKLERMMNDESFIKPS